MDQGVGQTPAYSFAFDLSATDVEIDLGDGADEVTVSGGMSARYGQKALQAALDYARDKLDAAAIEAAAFLSKAARETIPFSVDTTAAYYDLFGADVQIAAGDGFDRTHLTGELAETVNVADRISGDLARLDLETQSEVQVLESILGLITEDNPATAALALRQALAIDMSGIEAVTDLWTTRTASR